MSKLYITFLETAVVPLTYEPETEAYLDVIGIVNSVDTTYYSSTAQEITGRAIWTAVDAFVVSLKASFSLTLGVNNLSTKIDAIYPFIGGTATAHKYNLCNPLDTDAAFRLTFAGGWTHSETGALPNGSNAYARTYWIQNTNGSDAIANFGMYSRTEDTSALMIQGAINTVSNDNMFHVIHDSSNANMTINDNSNVSYTATPTTRFHFARRSAVNELQAYRDGTSLGTNVTNQTGNQCTLEFYLAARNVDGSSTQRYFKHEFALALISGVAAINNTQAGDIRTAVDTLQAALFRNV
mgnify:CR=1 FL=1